LTFVGGICNKSQRLFILGQMEASSSKTSGIQQQLLDASHKNWCIVPIANTTIYTLGF
jgi:hypothetical protein